MFYIAFFSIYLGLNAYLLAVFGSHVRLVSIADAYDQRALASDLTLETYAGYPINFLANAFNPFLIAVGMHEKRKAFMALGMLGLAFIYSIGGFKYLLMVCLLTMFIYYLCLNRDRIMAERLALIVIGCIGLPVLIVAIYGNLLTGLVSEVISQILMRWYGMPAVLTGIYDQAFNANPPTYYSHIRIISKFIDYPYDLPLGHEVARYFEGNPEHNMSANFWATDGIAAAGYPGVIFIGIIIGLVFSLVDRFLDPAKLQVFCAASVCALVALTDVSFFIALITGGGVLLYALIMFWHPASCPPGRRQQHVGSYGMALKPGRARQGV
jgi:hypothetical protein